jgi:hypothetical protein
MMIYVVAALFVIGVVLLVIGYRRSHRNLLLSGAIVLFASAVVQPFIQDFIQGFHGG